MLKAYLKRLFEDAMALNRRHILQLAQAHAGARVLDLGCDDGAWTAQVSHAAGATHVAGVELVDERAAAARARGIQVEIADLSVALPYPNHSFDLVHANQVIEHVASVDTFAAEVRRVLKPGGVALISTENGSSWHNVGAAVLGWQTFSLTNMSALKAGVGNPLSLKRDQAITHGTWTHKVIFNYRGLKEFFELHGFEVLSIKGAGYYPLPAWVGAWDVRHAHFLTIAVQIK